MSTYEERKKSGLSRDLARKLKRKKRLRRKSRHQRRSKRKSVESSWSIGHILEHEWAVWAVRVVRGKKVDLRFSKQLLRVVFSTFCGQ
jgi:hypothetical protein